jgi:hypothetical protein
MAGNQGPDVVPAGGGGAGIRRAGGGARESGIAADATAARTRCLPARSGFPLNVRGRHET